jgi:hypothetical protein
MAEWDDKLKEISNELNEHIMAVKGTLELIEVSSSEKELQALIVKAIERMDTIQRLSQETIVALKNCFDTIDEMKTQK